jgi:hypothetical protein
MTPEEAGELRLQKQMSALAPVENLRMLQIASGRSAPKKEKDDHIERALILLMGRMGFATSNDLAHKLRQSGLNLTPDAVSGKMRGLCEKRLVHAVWDRDPDTRIWELGPAPSKGE